VAGSYSRNEQGISEKPDAVRLTSMEATSQQLAEEAVQSEQWYHAITHDIWH
jgi:sulfide dehydrogenase [flavocytochrome c] flavoprotein subunit